MIKRFILHAKETAFIIEHDFILAAYLADRVIVFEGIAAIAATATPYGSFLVLTSWIGNLIAIVSSPQTTIAPHGDEQISCEVPLRPDKLPATCEYCKLNSVKDKEQKGLCPFDVCGQCDRPLAPFFVQFRDITSSWRSEWLRVAVRRMINTPYWDQITNAFFVCRSLVFRVVLLVKGEQRLM